MQDVNPPCLIVHRLRPSCRPACFPTAIPPAPIPPEKPYRAETRYSPSSDAGSASRTTVSALDGLDPLADSSVLAGAERLDTGEGDVAVTALGAGGGLLEVLVDELATRGLDDTSSVRLGVVGVALAQSDSLNHLSE